MAKETWKDLKGYKGVYQISNGGRIRSLPRTIVTNTGVERKYKGKILSPVIKEKTIRYCLSNSIHGKEATTIYMTAELPKYFK